MTRNEALQQIIDALKSLMDDPTPQLEEVRRFLAELSRSGKTSEMKSLLGKYGATKLSDIDPTNYAALLAEASMIEGFQTAKSSVISVFQGISQPIANVFERVKNTVSNAVSYIRGLFNFSWSLPQIKLPHFRITGSFSLNPPSVPHLTIDWYKKAMDNGMILNGPTIFGAKGNTLLGGGEAGSETVVGTESLLDMIKNAVSSAGTTINYGGVAVNVYATENQDVRALADEIEYRINNNLLRRRAAVGA